ncbi:MAG: hypothetical protein PHQ47_03710 [Candidatus Portnoybacteria bacterium]|nr:hypothetical protein [Candidatus Portnoybacteria bacterium]
MEIRYITTFKEMRNIFVLIIFERTGLLGLIHNGEQLDGEICPCCMSSQNRFAINLAVRLSFLYGEVDRVIWLHHATADLHNFSEAVLFYVHSVILKKSVWPFESDYEGALEREAPFSFYKKITQGGFLVV